MTSFIVRWQINIERLERHIPMYLILSTAQNCPLEEMCLQLIAQSKFPYAQQPDKHTNIANDKALES